MGVDVASGVAALDLGSNDPAYAVSALRKAQDAQRLQGAEAVRLIEESGPQQTKTDDGHISVRA